MLGRSFIIGLLALGLTGVGWAQPQGRAGLKMGPGGRLGMPGMGPGARGGLKKGPGGPPPPPPAAIDRWRGMSADERQQMVDRLPPERREVFRRRMEMWENMRPEERKGVADRFGRFRDLPAEQQRSARQAYRQLSQLPIERRTELRRELNSLRRATTEERAARFNSEEFQSKFDTHERSLVQDLVAALPE